MGQPCAYLQERRIALFHSVCYRIALICFLNKRNWITHSMMYLQTCFVSVRLFAVRLKINKENTSPEKILSFHKILSCKDSLVYMHM